MSASPNWTKEELDRLKDLYPKIGKCAELQEAFPLRPLTGICLKANRMGYKVINNIRKGRSNIEYLRLIEATDFIPLEEYQGSTVPILHMCGICEHEWLVRPQQVLREGSKCPECDLINRKNSLDKVDALLNNSGFTRLSEYTGALDLIRLKHNHCGYEWDTVYSHIQQESGCPLCNKGFGSGISKETLPEKATIYLLRIKTSTEYFLKIGVTSRPIKRRLSELSSRIPNISTVTCLYDTIDTGINILKKEKKILSAFNKFISISKFEGCSELLDINNDINLIKEIMNENI
jgi:predicted Zn-ribbon and HTH transcriptional regulator